MMKREKHRPRAGRPLAIWLGAVLIAISALFGPAAGAQERILTEEEEHETGWDRVYQFPVPEENIFIHDKSLPLPEVLKKLSAPSSYIRKEDIGEIGGFTGDFPLPLNDSVQAYIAFWTGKNRGSFKR